MRSVRGGSEQYRETVHPMERLRYVARQSHVPAEYLVRDAAMGLSDFVGEPGSLLIACKQILARQPASAPLVWLIAHALGAPDAANALWTAVEEIENDRTSVSLVRELPDDASVATIGIAPWLHNLCLARGDLKVVVVDLDGSADYELESMVDPGQVAIAVDPSGAGQALAEVDHVVLGLDALGPSTAIGRQGALALAATARHLGLAVWGVAATGTALPGRMFDGLTRRWHEAEDAPLWERPVEEFAVDLFDQVVTSAGVVTAERALAASGCPMVPELY